MTGSVKICGLRTLDALEAALVAGADLVGFVRFPRSPRHLGLREGGVLSAAAEGRATRVLLLVDPDDRELAEAVEALKPDMIQLHGRETPERVVAIQARTGRPILKAVGIGDPSDLERIAEYSEAADRILLDARPPPSATLPGGNGAAFDWRLLADARLDLDRTMLSGGLTAANVAAAIEATGLRGVDVSSSIESRPGVKDPAAVAAFVAAARAAFAARSEPARPTL